MVEFLLVAGILALGLLGLAALQAGAARALAGARNRVVALNLAVSALERESARVRAAGAAADDLALAGWTRLHDRDGQAESARPPFFTVTVTSGAGPDGTLRLRAAVAWQEGRGRTLRLERLTCR
jgi:Tfp pilus assembly protein PilV